MQYNKRAIKSSPNSSKLINNPKCNKFPEIYKLNSPKAVKLKFQCSKFIKNCR